MRIAIIDDLPKDRHLVLTYTNIYFSKHHTETPLLINSYDNGESFLSQFICGYYDIIFIDYYMDQLTGMELAKRIRKIDSSAILIFITASKDFAVEGYLVKASGYLVKPFTYEELEQVLSVLDLIKIKEKQFIEFANSDEPIRILLKDIVYCDIFGHYSQIHTLHSGTQRIRMTFSKLQEIISPYKEFLLCYRGCIVNINQIVRIENETFLMKDGARVPFRKKEQSEILKVYSEYLFQKVRNDEI